jgi:hypothetical protein
MLIDKLTVAALWQDFHDICLKELNLKPTDTEYVERRRTFYAAAFAILVLMRDVLGSPDVSEEEGVAVMQGMVEECDRFKEDLLAGRT